jgi:hypothetical protein
MINYPKSVPELFRDVVQIASDNTDDSGTTLLQRLQLIDSGIVQLNYQYGSLDELHETLAGMNQGLTTPAERFPLIWLMEDIAVDRRNARHHYGNVSLRVVIAYPTKSYYKSHDREVNVFAPILRPIYYNLLDAIVQYNPFSVITEDNVPHKMTERKYWGKEQAAANKLTDFVDAIDIENLELTIHFPHSYTPLIS